MRRALFVPALLGLVGCIPTWETVHDAIGPWRAEAVERLARADPQRVARLLQGAAVLLVADVATLGSALDGRAVAGWGTAAAITSDGYYLTARHCTVVGPMWLEVPRGDGARAWLPARLVAASDDVDVAVLKVEGGVAVPYAWEDLDYASNRRDVVAVGGGAQQELVAAPPSLRPGLSAVPGQLEHPLRREEIIASIPLRGGDSGGPVLSDRDRLVGIEAGCTALPWPFGDEDDWCFNQVSRPDPEWIAQVIDRDRRLAPRRLERPW